MPRKVFYSFHYNADHARAAQVRNMGVVEGNRSASDNDWESIKKGGDPAIKRWIDDQLWGKSCTVVLIGAQTAGRPWIKYEIESSWKNNKGLFGIYIHRLKDFNSEQADEGRNPFSDFVLGNQRISMSSIVKTYNPPYMDSKSVYAYIKDNFSDWLDEAIDIRQQY